MVGFLIAFVMSAHLPIYSQIQSESTNNNSEPLFKLLKLICSNNDPFNLATLTKLLEREPEHYSTPTRQSWQFHTLKGMNNITLSRVNAARPNSTEITINLLPHEGKVATEDLLSALHATPTDGLSNSVKISDERLYSLPWGVLSIRETDRHEPPVGIIKYLTLYSSDGFKYELAKRFQTKGSDLLRGLPYIGKPGDPAAAIQLINESLNKDPDNSSTYNLRSQANFASKNYDLALADINKAIELCTEKQSYHLYLFRASILQQMHKHSEALQDCQTALNLCAGDYSKTIIWYRRGLIYADLKAYKEAIQNYAEAMKVDYPPREVYLYRALAERALGNDIIASKYFQEAAMAKASGMIFSTCAVIGGQKKTVKIQEHSTQAFINVLASDLRTIMEQPDCEKELERLSLYTSHPGSRSDLYFDLLDIALKEKPHNVSQFGLTEADLTKDFPNSLKYVQNRLAEQPSLPMQDYRRNPQALIDYLKGN